MRTIGIRALKAQLSQVLRDVQNGETVLVTDRGRIVAEMRRPVDRRGDGSLLTHALARLAATGELRIAERAAFTYPVSPVSLTDGTSQELLDAEREERL